MGLVPAARLHIGLHRSLQRPAEGVAEANVVRGGPHQLLAWLESQLGLVGPRVNWTDRVVQYHGRLGKVKDPPFARSFKADPWATASNLLRRRDELLLAGWTPSAASTVPLVRSLGALEGNLLPGVPDRLRLVLDAFAQGLRLPAHAVELAEPPQEWPTLWRDVLARMTLAPSKPVAPRGAGALAAVQSNLLDGGATLARPDDSLAVWRVASGTTAVQYATRWMRGKAGVTVYCPDVALAPLLDAALHADGQPTMGVPRRSRAHPASQVLPLVLQLLWEPVNPYVLLDFVLLPVGPVQAMGYRLARALEKQPGYRSDAWTQAVQEILTDDADGKKTERLAKWLDHPRVKLGEPVASAFVEERCSLVAQWAHARGQWEAEQAEPNHDLAASLLSAAAQASALGKIAAQMGATITEAQLERLLDEVSEAASTDTPHEAQAGGATFVSSLADVRDCDALVWLGTTVPEAVRLPWTPGELDALRAVGLNPGVATQRTLRIAETNGLAHAKRLLVLDVESMEGPRHPLWLRLHGDLDVGGKRAGPLPRLEAHLEAGGLGVPTRRQSPMTPPAVRSQWRFEGALPLPLYTSATALEDRIACPLKWTLRHALNVRPSFVASIPDDFRLKGNFAHDLLHQVLPPGPAPDPAVAEERLLALFDPLLERNAAPLAIPRKIADRNRLRRDLGVAVRQFCTALRDGGYDIVGLEVPTQGTAFGLPLKGSIDCVVRSGNGGEAIVDFKLGGQRKFEEKLAHGRALQLATYAHSRAQAGQRVDAAAYFILATSRIITPTGGALRAAPRTVNGPSVVDTWARFQAAMERADDWVGQGRVPARPMQDPSQWDPGSAMALDPEEKEGHPVCEYCDYGALCGLRGLA